MNVHFDFDELFGHLPGLWGCKDPNSVFTHLNDDFAAVLGLSSPEEGIGKTDFDMPCQTNRCAMQFKQQDQWVMSTAQPLKILDVHPFAGGQWRAYIFTKLPLKNKHKKTVGVLLHGEELASFSTIKKLSLLSYLITQRTQQHLNDMVALLFSHQKSLTHRQTQVLFYLLRGKTAKMIAKILNISHRTVDEYLQQLKCKFDAVDRIDLIEKATSAGYWNLIPSCLFSTQLSLTLPEKF